MRIPSFEIRSERSIQLAKCDSVPKVMLIAGPNGAGKSTLLNAIRATKGYQEIIYLGPHRAMRRQNVQQRHLISAPISVEQLLAQPQIQGIEGVQSLGGQRDPWGYDDSGSYLKHALCQVEVERSQAIAARYDAYGEILRGSLVDPWKPLRELTNNLLPHLVFEKIDATNRDQIKCIWRVHGNGIPIDIDELSSGEKSIIQMFYPLIEHTIKKLLADVQGTQSPEGRADACILIDEPELHLHPNLQVKVLDYLRVLTTGSNMQVILATQSPTMVEYASFEELFLLRPPELVGPGENQLVQIADNEERLRVLRDIFGTTANLTALQPVIIVESTNEKDAPKAMPDRKLYRALHSGFDRVTLISGGGKSQCRALLDALDPAVKVFSAKLRTVALLDKDYTEAANDPRVILLPVNMVENFLLDPSSIWDAIQSVIERTGLSTVSEVEHALDTILDELQPQEIQRRVIQQLGLAYFRPQIPIAEIPQQARAFADDLVSRFDAIRVNATETEIAQQVKELKTTARRREEYHGKMVMDEFYRRFLQSSGLQKGIFKFEVARYSKNRKSVSSYFDGLFKSFEPAKSGETNGASSQEVIAPANPFDS